jgi:hypothetical protein
MSDNVDQVVDFAFGLEVETPVAIHARLPNAAGFVVFFRL